MSKILLINIDSTVPNLALHKIAMYYEQKGYDIIWDSPLFAHDCDKIFVSVIFPENKWKADEYEGRAIIGGTGWSIDSKLPDMVENMKPKINWGFTTRGCIRKCPWCFVPKKEGDIRIVIDDIMDIWDGKSKLLTLQDNNITAMPDHFLSIMDQIKRLKVHTVDFNQGLDHRLLTPELCKAIVSIRHQHGKVRFAFDHINYRKSVINSMAMLKENGMKDWSSRWYIYVGDKDNFETVYDRIKLIWEHKQMAYVMLDRDPDIRYKPEFIACHKWANITARFPKPIESIILEDDMKPYRKYFEQLIGKVKDKKGGGLF